MKYWIPKSWSETFVHEGLLFFVQRVQEMLFHFSVDIHRAPIHNTSTLIKEYIDVYNSVKADSVGAYQLSHIYSELQDSLLHDKILYANFGDALIFRLHDQVKTSSEENRFDLINYLFNLICPYYLDWIISYLKDNIPFGNHKSEIEYGAKAWISEQIMRGYTSEFIYSYTEQFFINSHIESLESLHSYFERFNLEKREYRIYIQISKKLADYFDILKSRISLSFDEDGHFSRIPFKRDSVICFLDVEALDHYKAVNSAYETINIFIKYYQFISNQRRQFLAKFCTIWDPITDKIYQLPIVPTGFKAIEVPSWIMNANIIDHTILGLQRNSMKTQSILDKAIMLHNSALQQHHPKDGFVNLWSILEVLCPQGKSSSKMDPILYSVLPILQNDYFVSVFSCIAEDLKDNLSDEDYQNLLDKLPTTKLRSKMAAFCLLPEHEQLIEDVFSSLTNYPVLRNKIYTLFILKDDKKELFALSKRYAQRVKWHFYRLYRARNSIVHSGTVPKRIKVLGEHLHSYVDSVMFEVAYKIGRRGTSRNISDIFIDTILLMKDKEKYFDKGGKFESTDIDVLFKDDFFQNTAEGHLL